MRKKVLVTSRSFGQIDTSPAELLWKNGFEVIRHEQEGLLTEQEFRERLADCDALIIGADPLTRGVMEYARKLRLVCKHGTGLDNIDLEAARARGITVTNVPALNSDAVADVTMALILDVSRRISYAAGRVKKGYWERCIGSNVCGKRLGIIGLGAVGQKVACRAQGFGMEILAYDPYLEERAGGPDFVRMAGFDEVVRESEILTLHVPLSSGTQKLISAPQMMQMRRGAILINTSRGGIVDEEALYRYLRSGHLGGAGLDVTQTEPPTGSPLLTLDNVTVLPHMASYSKEAITMVSMVCAQNVVNLFENKPLQYVV